MPPLVTDFGAATFPSAIYWLSVDMAMPSFFAASRVDKVFIAINDRGSFGKCQVETLPCPHSANEKSILIFAGYNASVLRRGDGKINKGKNYTRHARMWPRRVFERPELRDGSKRKSMLAKQLEFLSKPGVYVLYREDQPYYIGQATRPRKRLWLWAKN